MIYSNIILITTCVIHIVLEAHFVTKKDIKSFHFGFQVVLSYGKVTNSMNKIIIKNDKLTKKIYSSLSRITGEIYGGGERMLSYFLNN